MRPGSAPLLRSLVANLVPPSFVGPVLIGSTSTIWPGVWGGAPTLTYSLYRNGIAVPQVAGLTFAAAEAYGFLDLDIGPGVKWLVIPNGVTSLGVFTNSITTAMTDIPSVAASGVGWEARFATLSGSLVAAGINQGSAGPAQDIVQATPANQPTSNTADPLFSMRATFDTAGNQRLRANTPAFYTWLSDGTGMGWLLAAMSRVNTATFACDNRQAATTPIGFSVLTTGFSGNPTEIKASIGNGAVECFTVGSGATLSLGVPHFICGDHMTGQPGADGHIYMDTVLVGSANNTAVPSALPSNEAITVSGYNGPGFGWNGESAMFYLCKGVPTANEYATGFAYANHWYLGRDRFELIGDSNTEGLNTVCWRNIIGGWICAANFDAISVGTTTDPANPATPAIPRWGGKNHCGISGATIATHQALLGTEMASKFAPTVCVISLGTNDTATLADAPAYSSAMITYIASIVAIRPQCKFVLLGVPFLGPGLAARNTKGGLFNDTFLTTIMPWCVSQGITAAFVDLRPILGSGWSATYYFDDLHFNPAGHTLIAPAIFAGCQAVGAA